MRAAAPYAPHTALDQETWDGEKVNPERGFGRKSYIYVTLPKVVHRLWTTRGECGPLGLAG
jgi:hypothetical protein